MIVVLAQTKGGVGKTTLAVNLAVYRSLAGRDLLLVDADEQATASDFTAIRTEQLGSPGYTAIQLPDLRCERKFCNWRLSTTISSSTPAAAILPAYAQH